MRVAAAMGGVRKYAGEARHARKKGAGEMMLMPASMTE
jgi:hypothetical protein